MSEQLQLIETDPRFEPLKKAIAQTQQPDEYVCESASPTGWYWAKHKTIEGIKTLQALIGGMFEKNDDGWYLIFTDSMPPTTYAN